MSGFLEDIVSSLIVTEKTFLMADLIMVLRVLGAEHDCLIQDLQGFVEHHFVATTVAGEKPRYIVVEIGILAF